MKLTELEPRWWHTKDSGNIQGISFLCPHCRTQRFGVAFSNPIGGGNPEPSCHDSTPEGYLKGDPNRHAKWAEVIRRKNLRWQRTGETFEIISLSPSIDASDIGHWHGHITNGTIVGGVIKAK